LVKNPWTVLPLAKSSQPFTNVCQNLLVLDVVKSLSRTQSTWTFHRISEMPFSLFGICICSVLLPFALAIWGSSSTWIEAYFMGNNEKNMIHQKLLFSEKVWFVSIVLKKVSTNVHANFYLFMSDESWHNYRTHFLILKLLLKTCQAVSLSMLINSASPLMLTRRFCRKVYL
jgi:hypothetical protein